MQRTTEEMEINKSKQKTSNYTITQKYLKKEFCYSVPDTIIIISCLNEGKKESNLFLRAFSPINS